MVAPRPRAPLTYLGQNQDDAAPNKNRVVFSFMVTFSKLTSNFLVTRTQLTPPLRKLIQKYVAMQPNMGILSRRQATGGKT